MKLKIHIHTKGTDAVFVAQYASTKFKRLVHKRGEVTKTQFQSLFKIVPPSPQMVEFYTNHYKDKISYEVLGEKSVSIFKELMDHYASWYEEQTQIKPKIDGIGGKSMKTIIAHLRKLSANDDEVIGVFKSILDNWQNLDDFYQNQRELRQINSNINIILNQLKNGKSDSKTQAKSVSNDFRQKL